jgi:hypothetical protein
MGNQEEPQANRASPALICSNTTSLRRGFKSASKRQTGKVSPGLRYIPMAATTEVASLVNYLHNSSRIDALSIPALKDQVFGYF